MYYYLINTDCKYYSLNFFKTTYFLLYILVPVDIKINKC